MACSRGFLAVVVDSTVERTDREEVRLHVRIEEGQVTRISTAVVRGEKETGKVFEKLQGKPLVVEEIKKAVDQVLNRLRNIGYAYAEGDVETRIVQDQAKLILHLNPGQICSIGTIQIVGNAGVSSKAVLRGLTFGQGDQFGAQDLIDTQRQLYRAGVFRSVALGVADSVRLSNLVNVDVRLSERALRSVRLGGGYDTDEDLWASAALAHRNFGGGCSN